MHLLSGSSPALQQLIAFFEALLLGTLYAAVYDFYRSVGVRLRRFSAVLSFAADCLFWIAAAAVTIVFLVYRRRGEIYGYTYGGLAGGFFIYFYFFSKYLFPVWKKGFSALFKDRRPCKKINRCSGGRIWDPARRFFSECRIFHPLRRR